MSKKPSNRSITFKDIRKKKKEIDKLSTYVLEEDYENNKNTIIKYHAKFSEIKIQELLKEAFDSLNTDEEKELGYFVSDENFLAYIHFLIAVRFTNLGKQVPKNFEEQIPLMNELIDTGLFERIFNDVLPSEEVDKVFIKLAEFRLIMEKTGELIDSGNNSLEQLENKEIIDMFKKNEGLN